MATESTTRWRPDWAVAPGEILQEVLDERSMTQSELATRMARPIKTINEIVKAKTAITAETALQLERALGIDARFWNNLESNYREALAREQERSELEKDISWAKRFPLRALSDAGLLDSEAAGVDCVRELLRFFGVSSRAAWENMWTRPATRFRAPKTVSSRPESVASWLRWGEIQAAGLECRAFRHGEFRKALAQVRALTTLEPIAAALEKAQEVCSGSGVAVVIAPQLPHAPVSGASRWIASDKAVIQLSDRYKSSDQFWYSFFHEGGHLLTSNGRRDFVDSFNTTTEEDEAERAADEFARNELIPSERYAAFVKSADYSEAAVRVFARELGVAAGIVVARLQYDDYLDPSRLNSLKRPVAIARSVARPRDRRTS